jgi:CubicO group peptidase (beta-lactamase class C family)
MVHPLIRLPRLHQQTVPLQAPAELTRIGEERRTPIDVEAIWTDTQSLYATGLHPAIGLCIRHRGEVILDRTIGHVENAPQGPTGPVATPETLFNLFSASKLLTATVIHALAEDLKLALTDRVVDYIPAFGRHGKDGIRIRHLLHHTSGLPDMPSGVDPVAILASQEIPWAAICDLRPQSKPGTNVAYSPVTAWVLLEEIVRQVTGQDLRTVARQRLLDPLGFTHMAYGVGRADLPRVARHAFTGPPVPAPMSRIFRRTIGLDLDKAVALTNSEAFLTGILPSANVIGTGREVTRFLQLLLNEGELDGVRVLRKDTVRRAITDTTPLQLDSTFGFPIRYGLGMMKGGGRFSLFGLGTRGAFGHLGFTNVVIYADPSRSLCVSFLNTGKPMLAPGMLRWAWILQRLSMAVPRT